MKKNISFCLEIGKFAKIFAFLFAMIPFVACNDDKAGCDRALLDMVNHFNSDLPETLTKGLTASRLTVDDNNLNFVFSVDDAHQ